MMADKWSARDTLPARILHDDEQHDDERQRLFRPRTVPQVTGPTPGPCARRTRPGVGQGPSGLSRRGGP